MWIRWPAASRSSHAAVFFRQDARNSSSGAAAWYRVQVFPIPDREAWLPRLERSFGPVAAFSLERVIGRGSHVSVEGAAAGNGARRTLPDHHKKEHQMRAHQEDVGHPLVSIVEKMYECFNKGDMAT